MENKNINKKKSPPVFVYALGGLGEVGKNSYVIESGHEIWIIDAGIKFARDIVTIDGIIPSFDHLKKYKDRIKGLIVTHGHEDHIGAIPHLIDAVGVNHIFCGRLTAGLISNKLRERGVRKPRFTVINNKWTYKSRNFLVEAFNVNHSIPDAFGISFKTDHGTVVTTGDFKFDMTPVGAKADIPKMAKLGNKGVSLLLSDSTSSLVNDYSISEKEVSKAVDYEIRTAKGRVIVATFASNVNRVREIINAAIKNNKRVAIFGWSMEKVVKISQRIKYINLPDNFFVEGKELKRSTDTDIVIICTGTQGEPNAALSKISRGVHKEVKIRHDDKIVFASSAIPGNWEGVERVTNSLLKQGCSIVDRSVNPKIHASGHASKIELEWMIDLFKPDYFFPIHGETKMLVEHKKIGVAAGIKEENIFILNNGGRLRLENGIVTKDGGVHAEDIFVDETSLSGQSHKVIQDRLVMSKNGMVTITVGVDAKENKIIINPKFSSKGIMRERNNAKLISLVENEVLIALQKFYKETQKITYSALKSTIKIAVEQVIFEHKKINPIVTPIIMTLGEELEDPKIKPKPVQNNRHNNRNGQQKRNHNNNRSDNKNKSDNKNNNRPDKKRHDKKQGNKKFEGNKNTSKPTENKKWK